MHFINGCSSEVENNIIKMNLVSGKPREKMESVAERENRRGKRRELDVVAADAGIATTSALLMKKKKVLQ